MVMKMKITVMMMMMTLFIIIIVIEKKIILSIVEMDNQGDVDKKKINK